MSEMKHPWAPPRELSLLRWLHPLPLCAALGHNVASFCLLVSALTVWLHFGLKCVPPPGAEATVLSTAGFEQGRGAVDTTKVK